MATTCQIPKCANIAAYNVRLFAGCFVPKLVAICESCFDTDREEDERKYTDGERGFRSHTWPQQKSTRWIEVTNGKWREIPKTGCEIDDEQTHMYADIESGGPGFQEDESGILARQRAEARERRKARHKVRDDSLDDVFDMIE